MKLLGLYMKHFPKEVYELGKELLKTDEYEGICAFGVVDEHGEYDYREEDVCHAALQRDVAYNLGTPAFIVDRPFEIRTSNDVAKAYTRYVLEYSPYAEAFAEPSIEQAWRRGYYIYTADVDANILLGALVAARMVHETPDIPNTWYKLVKAGVSPNMAFLAAHMVYTTDGHVCLESDTDEGHVAIVPSWFDHNAMSNFYAGKHDHYGYYSQEGDYRGFNGMWGENSDVNGGFNYDIYRTWRAAVMRISDVADQRIALFNHSFNEKNDARNRLPIDVGIPTMAKILNDYEKEHKYAA